MADVEVNSQWKQSVCVVENNAVCSPVFFSLLIGLEPCPSLLLQRHMAELLSVDKDMAASFLNSVLNQLNWAFSEFIGMIQEVREHHMEDSAGSTSVQNEVQESVTMEPFINVALGEYTWPKRAVSSVLDI